MTESLRIQMEFMAKRFQECVKEFDDNKIVSQKLLEDHKALNQRMDVESKDVDYLTDRISEIMNTITIFKKDLSDQINLVSNSVTEISNDIPLMKSQLQVRNELFEHFSQKINKILSQVNELESAEKGNIQNIYTEIESLKNELENVKNVISSQSQDIWKEIRIVSSEMTNINNLLSELSKKYILNNEQILDFNNKLELFKSDFKDAILIASSMDRKFTEDLIRLIPAPAIPSIEDAKKAMAIVLEPVSLDAKNANLRSVNNESKVLILEKRLEQLQLVINSMKL